MTGIEIHDGNRFTNSHWTWKSDVFGDEKPIILVDYDHTITTKCLGCADGLDGDKVQTNAAEALRELSKTFQIYIFTGTLSYVENAPAFQRSVEDIKANLKKHGIPFDKVLQIKPPACFIIDDRAIYHTSWKHTMTVVKERLAKR